jgi:outer membrane protein OmpA-like peptidoglycan-associated protein
MSRLLAIVLSFCFLLTGTLSSADTDRLGLRLKNKVSGKTMPALVLKPTEKVRRVKIKLTRSGDNKVIRLQATNLAAGVKKELEVRQEYGKVRYVAEFEVKWAKGEDSKFTMKFAMERTKKLELDLDPEDVDLDKRTMSFKLSNDAKKAELIFYGKDGKKMKMFTKKYNGKKAGTKLTFKWKDPGGDFAYMDLKVYDTAGFWKGVRLTPFSISIPHERIEFDSGKWNIKKSEEPKLKKALKHIKAELAKLKKHGTKLPLRFYIAGYTDTVGSKASNRTLSNNRARSIASWFRRNGLHLPVYYQGFGEEVLAVDTPDETDEPRNRRAIFVLATQMPAKSKTIPKQNWKKI